MTNREVRDITFNQIEDYISKGKFGPYIVEFGPDISAQIDTEYCKTEDGHPITLRERLKKIINVKKVVKSSTSRNGIRVISRF